jgi:serine/threonine protein kinase
MDGGTPTAGIESFRNGKSDDRTPPVRVALMPVCSTTVVLDALCQYRLLEPAQLEELTGSLHARFPDAKAVARELIQRGWLTPYQANHLLQGKAQELVLGSYLLLERLGEGGMGQVFKARHGKLGRVVALKVIRKERLDSPDAVRRFQREVRAAAALDHPHIVRALDADEIGGAHLLVMEYIDGATDLSRLIKKNGPLPVPQACEYIRQAALGLQHASERGLVHRDIKPANLLRTADGKTVKILDMGLARLHYPGAEGVKSSTMTQQGVVMGTPDYIAPEQALEAHTVDIRADLYSLGCTFYYLLAGRVPFPGGTFIKKINRHQCEEPQPVEQLRPDLPAEVAGIVRRLMAKRPEDRYQTPAEVAAALASLFSQGSGPILASGMTDRTVAERQPVGAEPEASRDTLGSPFAHIATSDTAEAADSPRRLRQRAEERRWWRFSVAGGAVVLVGVIALLFLLLKELGGRKPPVNEEDVPVVAATPSEKTPAKVDDAWLKEVAAMPADKQVDAVADKLKELNPGYDGKVTQKKIEGGVVTELGFFTDNVTDISPVRALAGLRGLAVTGSGRPEDRKGKLADLSPLKGMNLATLDCHSTQVADLSPLRNTRLTSLACHFTPVSDLSPLEGMRLTSLHCYQTPVSNLSPLKGMQLTELAFNHTPVSDLSPLKDMKLGYLDCCGTPVSDLSPLNGMPLTVLLCYGTQVANLSPLKDMKLTRLDCGGTKVSDLAPLKGMPLQELRCDFNLERDAAILRSIKTLENINGKPAAEFWEEVDETKL